MAHLEGETSNPKSLLLAEWSKNSTGNTGNLSPLEIEQFLDTLAEWNTYLENHVPYFRERNPEIGEYEL